MNNDELFKALADCMTELEVVWKARGSRTENSYVKEARSVIAKNKRAIPKATEPTFLSECCGVFLTGGRCSTCWEGCVGEEVEIDDNEPAHTAGPWTVTAHSTDVFTEHDDKFVAHCFDFVIGAGVEESQANARLISAAPDLLEACKAALTEGDDYVAIKKLKAAIAKAEGSSLQVS